MVRLLLTTALAAAPLLWAGAAAAQCAPDAPANGATVSCTGTDMNGFLFGGGSGRDNIALTVQSGATVTNGANLRGIDLRDGAAVTVNGAVSTTNNDGIRVRNGGTVLIQGSVTATGADGDGVQGDTGLDLDLFGTISAGKDGVNAGNNANIFLGTGARITAGDEGLQLGDNAIVDTAAGSVIDAADEGIEGGNDFQMTYRGTLTAFDDALNVGERANIVNLGRIANIQTQANIDAGDEAQDAIDLDSGLVTNGSATNGTAEVTSTFGDAIDFDVSSTPLTSVIDNYGLIRGGNRAVETDVLNVSGQWVINRATGRIIGGSGMALNLGAGEDRYDHYAGGTLTGGIDFGSGDDLLQILGLATGQLGGAGALIDGGAGNDSVRFDSFAFHQIAGTVLDNTFDLRLGSGPDAFRLTLAGFESFFFNDSLSPRSLADVARRLSETDVVPLPASALLLIAGLGGLAAMRRRNGMRAAVQPLGRTG